jgi:hypothetical protein
MVSKTRDAIIAVIAIGSGTLVLGGESTAHPPRHVPTPTAQAYSRSPSFEPAKIIEVRPGVFISSFGCITDVGQGRWTRCDAN